MLKSQTYDLESLKNKKNMLIINKAFLIKKIKTY